MSKPYKNLEENDEYIIREFAADVDSSELVWHRDKESRIVIPMNENDWMVQLDDELPKPINEAILIEKELFHRVIGGTTPLKVKIYKV